MRLATLRLPAGGTRAVRVEGDEAVLLDAPDVGALLALPDWRGAAAGGTVRTPYAVGRCAPVIPAPGRIACVGLNYRSHIEEGGRALPAHPTLFAKWPDALVSACDEVLLPGESAMVDWEAELVVVVGATVRRADRAEATAAIAGYTVGNDVSVRDWQRRTNEWLQGKAWERSTPLGAELVTADDLDGDPARPDLRLTCSVDGELVQDARTGDLLFDAADLVSYLSTVTTLRPGDLVFTGTPSGVGVARRPPRFLTPGSRLVTTIERLGSCDNRCVADPSVAPAGERPTDPPAGARGTARTASPARPPTRTAPNHTDPEAPRMLTQQEAPSTSPSGRLRRLTAAIEADIDAGTYHGMDLQVTRHGETVLEHRTGWADRAAGVRLTDQVMCTMSVVKAMTAVVALAQVEQGRLALTDRVADHIPEFAANGKARVTVGQLMLHTSGLPWQVPTGVNLGDLAAVTAHACALATNTPPGQEVTYNAVLGFSVLGEVTRRVAGGDRRFRDVMDTELFAPLGMHDTAIGVPERLSDRYAPVAPAFLGDNGLPVAALVGLNNVMRSGGEMPAGGAVTTAVDLTRFGEMLRRGGELDGVRVLSPAMVSLATRSHTGTAVSRAQATYNSEVHGVDPRPANVGLGFAVRGTGLNNPPFGSLNSPATFGMPGAGSAMFWIDPEHDAVFAALSTGLMEGWTSSLRYQRLSDLAVATFD